MSPKNNHGHKNVEKSRQALENFRKDIVLMEAKRIMDQDMGDHYPSDLDDDRDFCD